ncbi:hypothetical protein COT94_02170 [Candidatus Falkowbacteria bacterium CG10_big_fil_rev_8_21_14_0_10_37_14]|uniref:DUF6938 domain-containing protein n=1 Tax=Candidatus Falkowbacteria bacterium CG10_big_fil_rev_8_21_14_0_10_37_14 TaxID=1974561 RepID=A0A2M6WTB8_9BACT|nr:hypothetical protein [Candidatus Falkowbacteria bacterium]PIT96047.1 MAG: hypothetical protein COT94_02170 [Candidatus Falkowbacteria bacterium CG10_big_fil_rev_8_21_14_0_10_37_14]
MTKKLAHIIAVDMGYGHQRAAYPLQDLGGGEIINANNYPGITKKEKNSWNTQTGLYETISVFKKIPIFGPVVFGAMDRFQDIPSLYPHRDLRRHTSQQLFFYNKVRQGLGQNLIKKLNRDKLPMITTFPVPIYFAENFNFKQQIYCVVCDADISRFWAPLHPEKSKTIYLVPTTTAASRLTMYGVNPKQIILTGFPLPKENIGGETKPILKQDLANRLSRLDPHKTFRAVWPEHYYPEVSIPSKGKKQPITLMLAIGGAGAQADLAEKLIHSLYTELHNKRYKLILVAGVRKEVKTYFEKILTKQRLPKNAISILFAENKSDYFAKFNKVLHDTDILITKPSELSFYAGLGLPIIMTEPVGAQEIANRKWLLSVGAGIDALDWSAFDEWLNDWIITGRLAGAAFLGYRQAPNMGTYNIERLIQH